MHLTVTEVCERTNLSKYTIYRLIKSGHLRAIRVVPARGRPTYKVDAASLDEWVSGDVVASEPVVPAITSANATMSTQEVMARLQCSRDTVRRLIDLGEIEAYKRPGTNGHLRVLTGSVEAFIERSRVTARKQPA